MKDVTRVIVLGALFWVAAGVYCLRKWMRLRRWRQANGTIVEIRKRAYADKGGGFTVHWSPVIKFTVVEGDHVLFLQDPLWQTPLVHREGQLVKILYDPMNPT